MVDQTEYVLEIRNKSYIFLNVVILVYIIELVTFNFIHKCPSCIIEWLSDVSLGS